MTAPADNAAPTATTDASLFFEDGRRSPSSWIAYVGPVKFPWGQAGSRRVYGIARSLVDAGHNVVVAAGDGEPAAVTELCEASGAARLAHIGLNELPNSRESNFQKSVKILRDWGRRTAAWLEAQSHKPSHVIVYGGSAQYMFHLKRWCARYDVPLIVDVVEWYDPRQLIGGLLGPLHISAKLALRRQYPRASGVIAISSFLETFYRERGCKVIRIPPTMDVAGIQVEDPAPDDHKLRLVYTGTPGKKDLLAEIISGVAIADPAGQQIDLKVVGPTIGQVKDLLDGREIPASINVTGSLPQQEIGMLVQRADFSVLLREPLRFAEAGFPTKFCESLANGTPAISNITSDLGNYLHDGREGLVCRDQSAGALASVLQRALSLDRPSRRAMRGHARQQALDSFDFRKYVEPLEQFLKLAQFSN